MPKEKTTKKYNDGWCFAIVNNRLAEIFFSSKEGIWAHAYVQKNEFSKKEQKMIDTDVKKYVFSYRKGVYREKIF